MEIEIGSPVILKEAKGLKKHGLFKNMKGVCNSLTTIEDVNYLMFRPDGVDRFYWTEEKRFVLDEERENQVGEGIGE